MNKPHFQGWYFKHTTQTQAIAIILSIHTTKKQEQYACIQVITKETSYLKKYPWNEIKGSTLEEGIEIGSNSFSLQGITIDIDFSDVLVQCQLEYHNIVRVDTPIMGAFRYLKFMECSHEIYSLSHQVTGWIKINNQEEQVDKGVGYIEGDRGKSFPKSYLWTQCNFQNNTIVLAIGNVPLWRLHFNGIIGHIYYKGKHYRLATYCGAKISRQYDGFVRIKQKPYKLVIQVLNKNEKSLQAPKDGDMARTIQESVVSSVRYQFYIANKKVFDIISDSASFETDIA